MIKKTILGSLFMTCALTAGAQGIYQFADPGFEQNWTNKKEPGNGWHSFATAGGGLASFASMSPSPEHVAEGYQSAHSVKLTSKFAGIGSFGANANGNLTTGRINMGNMDPINETNFNHTDLTGDSKKNLEPQYLEFAGTPDAVTFYAKFTAGSDNANKQGRGQFILHDEFPYQDPEVDDQVSHRVAKASRLISESTEWKKYTVNFVYDQDVKPAKQYLLASFTTNPVPGESTGDVLYIDEIHFVYNSELASLTYDGKPVSEIANTINLSDQVYDATKLSYTLTGKGATAERSYNAQTGVLTLTVKGNDWSVNNENQHVYTIQFKAFDGDMAEAMVSNTRLINVNFLGKVSSSLNTVSLNNADGAVSFTMENFSFSMSGSTIPIGNVTLDNVVLSENADGSTHVTAYNEALALLGGNIVAEVTVTGNVTAEDSLTANVDINWRQDNGSVIPITAEVSPVPFAVSVAGRTLAVTGELSSNLAQLVMVGESANISAIDLMGATLTGAFSTEDFGAAANCLFLVPEGAEFTGNNVVKEGACANLVLTDGQPFYAPENFTASQITYNRVIATSTDKDEVYTFVLPFTFTADKVNGTVYELTGVNDGVLDFTSIEGELKANRPYLVVSNGTDLLNASKFAGEVSATDELTYGVDNVAMVGTYQATEVKSEGSESWYGYNADGKFVKAKTGIINPFRAAIKSTGIAPSSYALKMDGTVTGILNLENPNAKVDVYTIGGVCVRKNVPAASALNGLSRGVYIVGGQKVVK